MKKTVQPYSTLNSRQQENYNFHKVAAVLANYGYSSIRLSDDWQGADFLAIHIDGTAYRLQLKGRIAIDRKYLDKDIWIAVHDKFNDSVYVYPHDEMVEYLLNNTNLDQSRNWTESGTYSFPSPSKGFRAYLDEKYRW
jgi:hypothetical protein